MSKNRRSPLPARRDFGRIIEAGNSDAPGYNHDRRYRQDLPPDLDPAENPIIAIHFFGWHSPGTVAAEIAADLQFRRRFEVPP